MSDFTLYVILTISVLFNALFLYVLNKAKKLLMNVDDTIENANAYVEQVKSEVAQNNLTIAAQKSTIFNLNAEIKSIFNTYSSLKSKVENQITIIQSLRKKERQHKYLLTKYRKELGYEINNKRKVSSSSEATGSQK
jgi:septal ring factor EnvC (AmiA/AmiB activator)